MDRLEVEDDQLVVSGFWSGVRGLRFVRPTLVSDDLRILATLEHKPWAPSDDSTWTAAFPWDGADVDADRLTLAVSSQVSVPLGASNAPVPGASTQSRRETIGSVVRLAPRDTPPDPPASAVDQSARDITLRKIEAASPELDDLQQERDALRRRLADATAAHDEVARERAATARDRDRALQQLEEAIEAREAAVRTRARMQVAHDEALAAREAAEAELAQAKAEREEANAQRDEVLLAYRAMRLQLQGEHAEQDRAASDDPDGQPRADDEPIGVRTMPAARTVMSELQRPRREQKLVLSQFDLWIIRVLGVVAAGCFILLLFSILRVFL